MVEYSVNKWKNTLWSRKTGENLDQLRARSQRKALELRKILGLSRDPTKIDGFKELDGLLSKYAQENDTDKARLSE